MNPKDPYGVPMGVVPRFDHVSAQRTSRCRNTPAALVETLHWHSASSVPDDDRTVIMWVQYADEDKDWSSGWWDGYAWRHIAPGGLVSRTGAAVLYWAEPAGPTSND